MKRYISLKTLVLMFYFVHVREKSLNTTEYDKIPIKVSSHSDTYKICSA